MDGVVGIGHHHDGQDAELSISEKTVREEGAKQATGIAIPPSLTAEMVPSDVDGSCRGHGRFKQCQHEDSDGTNAMGEDGGTGR
uniref:Uncharacterized protein n=1 Tax=Panagrellus redivivus TaxID=6233 RepID=A0A7E4UMD7_PANRE